mmetsp:Transcript_51048/g.120932  ORF Transcript_51048/g.120932 Transcript_51048/m.120932 type:complete len:250 (+) Transcript_51048:1663-2412(+)
MQDIACAVQLAFKDTLDRLHRDEGARFLRRCGPTYDIVHCDVAWLGVLEHTFPVRNHNWIRAHLLKQFFHPVARVQELQRRVSFPGQELLQPFELRRDARFRDRVALRGRFIAMFPLPEVHRDREVVSVRFLGRVVGHVDLVFHKRDVGPMERGVERTKQHLLPTDAAVLACPRTLAKHAPDCTWAVVASKGGRLRLVKEEEAHGHVPRHHQVAKLEDEPVALARLPVEEAVLFAIVVVRRPIHLDHEG